MSGRIAVITRIIFNAANMVDKWMDIWDYIQSNPFYKNKTAIFITTDHGRGNVIKKNGEVMARI